jgi:hypothetical protein
MANIEVNDGEAALLLIYFLDLTLNLPTRCILSMHRSTGLVEWETRSSSSIGIMLTESCPSMCPSTVQLEVLTKGESTPESSIHDLQRPPCIHSVDQHRYGASAAAMVGAISLVFLC